MTDLPLGKQFQVNTYTPEDQTDPAIATDADGEFVVTWASDKQDGEFSGVYAQRYSQTGAAIGNEFRVNTTVKGDQDTPDVAMDSNGNFTVVWTGRGNDPAKGSGGDPDWGIWGQRYNRFGNSIGTEFQVNTTIKSTQDEPQIAMSPTGEFVVVWKSQGFANNNILYAQRFNSQGIAQGSEFTIATSQEAGEAHLDTAMDVTGNFVVTWETANGQNQSSNIFVQRYDRNGIPQGTAQLVDRLGLQEDGNASVAMNAAGDFVLAWKNTDQKIRRC
jgi:hypothetical protein